MPTQAQLAEALTAAGNAHHDYESNFLEGNRDEQWPGWYAAFVIGRLDTFTTPTSLARWLSEASGDGEWSQVAAAHVSAQLDGG